MGTRVFQKKILSWWKSHKRDLPWRRTHNPYTILVSEVMLQQTQVQRVLPKYREFIERYPTVNDLAQSSPADVLRLWKGLGYNRRALYLKRASEIIVRDFGGTFPNEEALLVKLPGLGKYTARALLVFAFEKDVAMVDTNIRQIITHFFYNDLPQSEKSIQETADMLLPIGRSWEWHQALMDYGALALQKIKKKKKESVPFIGSNRYIRGKVIDRLRVGKVKESEFENKAVIKSLLRDGLIERIAGMLQLPSK